MRVGNFKIDKNNILYVAEISGNHAGKLNILKQTIRAAIKSGANAIKLQIYNAEDLTLNSKKKDFLINGTKNKWNKKYLFDIYKNGETPLNFFKKSLELCKKNKILCFASPFSIESVDNLERLNCPAYKIASLEITNFPLLKRIAKTKKPIFISTGWATLPEIYKAVKIFKNNKNICILKCSVSYPANTQEINLNTILDLRKRFKKSQIGYSDHTIGNNAAISAVTLGATVIEKHFILNKNINSIDNFFSCDPSEMRELITMCNQSKLSVGKVKYGPTKSEKKSLIHRRSIYISKKISIGERINKDNIKIIRPSKSLKIEKYNKIFGKIVKKNFDVGSRINLKDLK